MSAFNPREDGFVKTLLMDVAEEMKAKQQLDQLDDVYNQVMAAKSLSEVMKIVSYYKNQSS